MKKRILNVLKKSGFDYFNFILINKETREVLKEELITKKGLEKRIVDYSNDFENGLININNIDEISVPYLLSFEIDNLRDFGDTFKVFVEGVVVVTR